MKVIIFLIILTSVSAQTITLGIAPKYSQEVDMTRFKKIARYIESKSRFKIKILMFYFHAEFAILLEA